MTVRHPATHHCDTNKTAGHNPTTTPTPGGVAPFIRHPTRNTRSEHVRHPDPYRGRVTLSHPATRGLGRSVVFIECRQNPRAWEGLAPIGCHRVASAALSQVGGRPLDNESTGGD